VSDCDYCDTHNDSRYMPAGPIDHGETKGLGDDDHPQYFHLSQGQTVTGMTLFNPGTPGAPFKVYSDYVVGNLNCDLLDGYTADDFSYDEHDHSGDYLVECADCNGEFVNKTGDTMTGQLDVSTSLDSAGAVHAFNGSAAGYGVFGNGYQYGVYGQNWSTTGDNAGVRGWAAGETGAVAGVIGQSSSSAGYGVKGEAFKDSGLNYGVFGTTASSSGFGVYGENTAAGGTGVFGVGNFGVSGESSNTDGVGVYGLATAGSGTTFGVYGQVDSPDGWGVYSPDNIGTSGDYKYSNARTGYYIVTPADMAPNTDGYNYGRNGLYLVNQTGDQQFWNAPVHIPDGATITSLDVWATDYSTCLVRGTIWIQMIDDVSNCVESAVIGETNSSSTSTSNDVQLLSDTSITASEELCSVTFDPRIVDHSGNTHYQLEIWLNGGSSGCSFHRARITYTYDTVKP
ncbi:MAG: hypothetical protein GY854_29185, partial [Deltaproteobacteria bacterium]|nr:hypothetical protein [Deltaproteobacteria bacterium]